MSCRLIASSRGYESKRPVEYKGGRVCVLRHNSPRRSQNIWLGDNRFDRLHIHVILWTTLSNCKTRPKAHPHAPSRLRCTPPPKWMKPCQIGAERSTWEKKGPSELLQVMYGVCTVWLGVYPLALQKIRYTEYERQVFSGAQRPLLTFSTFRSVSVRGRSVKGSERRLRPINSKFTLQGRRCRRWRWW